MMKLLRSPAFNLAASAAIAAAATGIAYDHLGFLGVMAIGLLLMFMSVQSDIQREGMRGPAASTAADPIERVARKAEGEAMARFWRLAGLLGAVLAAVGLAGFALLQLPP